MRCSVVGSLTPCLLTIALFAMLSCKSDCEKFDWAAFRECNNNLQLDSAGTANELLGRWRWQYTLACGETLPGASNDYKMFAGVVIEFRADSSSVIDDNGVTSTARWQLELVSSYDGYRLTNPDRPPYAPHEALWGPVVFCDDLLLCTGHVDGPANLFVRE